MAFFQSSKIMLKLSGENLNNQKTSLPALIFLLLLVGLTCGCQQRNQIKKIGILPLGQVSQQYIDTIRSSIASAYNVDVYVLPNERIPKTFFVNTKSPRFRADSIIHYIKRIKPDSLDIVLGITDSDISMTKRGVDGKIKAPVDTYRDWGVFGLGYRPGPSSVVSTFRIKNTNQDVFISRLKKICLHEVGHNAGLSHCTDTNCYMRDAAESISTIDNVSLSLCRNCVKKLK